MTSATISGNDFLDILFNGRNKDYGAYDLRRKYDQRVRNAILGTASVALVIIGGYAVSNRLMASGTHIRIIPATTQTTLRDLELPEVKIPPPPAFPSTPPPVASTVRNVVPLIMADNKVPPQDEMPRMDEMENKAVGLTTTVGDPGDIDPQLQDVGTGVVVMPPASAGEDRSKIFTSVEIPPSFPGGEAALARYLGSHIRYPHIAAETGISGPVYVQFVVDYDGNVKDVKVVSAPHGGGLEEEATRVIKAMPKWKPGKQNGRAVSVLYNIPVRFTLN